jgi:hypothetical protein
MQLRPLPAVLTALLLSLTLAAPGLAEEDLPIEAEETATAMPASAPAPTKARSAYLWEGFEHEINWEAGDGAATVDRQVTGDETTEGARALRILFKAATPAAWAGATRKESMDWSPYGAVVLDLWVPEGLAGARASLVIQTGEEDKVTHEAFLPTLHAGWNRDLRVDLLAATWLSAASNYEPHGWLRGRSDVRKVTVRFYPGAPATGGAVVDRIRLERTGLLVIGDLAVNPVVEVTASGVHLGYVPPDLRLRRRDFAPVQSFDDSLPWTAADAGVSIEPETGLTSYGKRALAVRFPASPEGFDLDLGGLESRLAGSRLFRLEVYSGGTGESVALRLENTDGNEYESSRKKLAHGWNALVWDFTDREVWHGGVMEPGVLDRLVAVVLNVASNTPGRLVFDGAAVGSVRLASAAKAGARFRVSYHPSPGLEVTLTPRVENTYYGSTLRGIRDAGAEGWLDAGSLRADLGGFRTGVLYRTKVTAFDNPINALVSPDNFGNEVAAVESQGRVGPAEVQVLAASRLEYRRYNSHLPTGFGPEALVGVRMRGDAWGGVRVGGTYLEHAARYGEGVSGIPRRRHTAGVDAEGSVASGDASLALAAEGAVTGGDRYETGAIVPAHDRYYAGATASPSWGRVGLSFGYSLLGYDFDAAFTKKGGNQELVSGSGSLQLDGLPGVRALEAVPLTGGTLAKNLALSVSAWRYETRDRYRDPVTGATSPMATGQEVAWTLGNDAESTPNFGASVSVRDSADPWTENPAVEEVLTLRQPLALDVVAYLTGERAVTRTRDLMSGESGESRVHELGVELEREFETGLVVSATVTWEWSRDAWEGAWGDTQMHRRVTATARQPLGASTEVRVDYGVPALYGGDYGAQDTLDVVTVYVKSSF